MYSSSRGGSCDKQKICSPSKSFRRAPERPTHPREKKAYPKKLNVQRQRANSTRNVTIHMSGKGIKPSNGGPILHLRFGLFHVSCLHEVSSFISCAGGHENLSSGRDRCNFIPCLLSETFEIALTSSRLRAHLKCGPTCLYEAYSSWKSYPSRSSHLLISLRYEFDIQSNREVTHFDTHANQASQVAHGHLSFSSG